MLVALVVLFPGSAGVGVSLAHALAPGSWLAEVASFFALPLAFAFSLQAWYGFAVFGLIVRLIGWLVSGRRPRFDPEAPLTGSIVFLVFSSAMGALAGLVVGLLSSTHSIWFVFLVYCLVGSVHGAAGWRLARAGVLVPPDSV